MWALVRIAENNNTNEFQNKPNMKGRMMTTESEPQRSEAEKEKERIRKIYAHHEKFRLTSITVVGG